LEGNPRLKSRILLVSVLCLFSGSLARAQKWARLGPEGGMVLSLGTGMRGAVFAGTADGHVFASEDAGQHWELRGRVGTRTDAVVSRLVSHPGGTGRLFAAVWYQEAGAGGGVFLSEDGGRTWRPSGLEGEAVRALEIASADSNEFVAGTLSGVFHSGDAGKSWQRISPSGDEELRRLDSVAFDPRDAKVIYAGTYHLPWKTVDGGKSWKPVIAGLIDDSDIMSLRVDASNPERVYLSACSGIYRSENQGGSWTKLQGIPYAARRTQAIIQDTQQPKTLFAATTEGLWVTRDSGESWERTTPKDWVINSVVVLAGTNEHERVVVGTDGQGILVSDDTGETFMASNAGFTHRVVAQLAGDPRQPTHLLILVHLGGAQLQQSPDAGKSWAPMPMTKSGAGKAKAFDAELVERVYGTPSGWFIKLRDGHHWLWDEQAQVWKEWNLRLALTSASVSASMHESMRARTPATLQVAEDSLAFAGDELFAITNQGVVRCNPSGSCSRLKAFGRTSDGRAIWVSPNGQVLYVVAEGKLGRSSDQGGTAVWSDLPVPDAAARWIDVVTSPSGNNIFLGTDQGIYQTNDGGAAWQRLEAGLPAGKLEQWLKTEKLWITTLREGGIYVSYDSGRTWERVDHDAERGRVTGLAETEFGVLAVGSQSEGALRLSMKSSSEGPLAEAKGGERKAAANPFRTGGHRFSLFCFLIGNQALMAVLIIEVATQGANFRARSSRDGRPLRTWRYACARRSAA
jgi:photosystem II stability/assembly factor-like uncharacterized protein